MKTETHNKLNNYAGMRPFFNFSASAIHLENGFPEIHFSHWKPLS